MTFEKSIKILSASLAIIVLYVFVGGMYLSFKGYISDGKGGFVLGENPIIKDAHALEVTTFKSPTKELLEDKFLGSKDAEVKIYEISSFTCSHCATFNQRTLPLIEKNFIDNNKVSLVHVDFPFDGAAMGASMIANCATNARTYYKLVSLIFKNQKQWVYSRNTKDLFINYAKQVGISEEKASKCLEDKDLIQKIANKKAYFAKAYNINSTPSFVITNGKDVEIINGAQPYQVFVAAIEKVSEK